MKTLTQTQEESREKISDMLRDFGCEMTIGSGSSLGLLIDDLQAEAWHASREEVLWELNLEKQKPDDYVHVNASDTNLRDFCLGYNTCKEYVEWALAGRPDALSTPTDTER